jgi:hypothetical protein
MIHTDTGQTLGSNDSSFLSDGSKSTFRVMFKEPIEVQANSSYTACATLKVSMRSTLVSRQLLDTFFSCAVAIRSAFVQQAHKVFQCSYEKLHAWS